VVRELVTDANPRRAPDVLLLFGPDAVFGLPVDRIRPGGGTGPERDRP